jgi:hypothetical protein
VQSFATGTSGTDFAISSATATHTFNLPTASAANRGALSSTDWSTFNGKFTLPALTSGSVLFSNGTTIAQDNSNLFWDDTNNRLGIGTNAPAQSLHIAGNINGGFSGLNISNASAGNAAISTILVSNDTGNFTVQAVGSGFTGSGVLQPNSARFRSSLAMTNGFYLGTGTTAPITFFTADNERFKIFGSTGNVLIQNGGTFTDAGFRLDVNGTARVSGTTTITPAALTGTAATSALDIAQTWNTTGTPSAIKLNITDTASNANSVLMDLQVGGVLQFKIDKVGNVTANSYGNKLNTALLFVNGIGQNQVGILGNNTYKHRFYEGSTNNSTSGNTNFSGFLGGFTPTSGTGVWNLVQLNPTINQTGGANGITRGLYINPTLTAAADFRAIEVSSGITILGAATTAKASLRIPSGTAPTSPTNGDIWFDGTDLKIRVAGVTRTIVLL